MPGDAGWAGCESTRFVPRLRRIRRLGITGARADIDAGKIMRRRLSISGSTLRARDVAFKAAVAAQLHEKVWPLLETGKMRPVIQQVFAAADAARAHALMEGGTHIGKLMLQW